VRRHPASWDDGSAGSPSPTPPPDPFGVAADLIDPQPDPYSRDPVGWVGARLRERLWSKQREIAVSVRDNRFTAVQSCHGPGKSFTASRLASWWLETHPPGEAFVVSTAPSFNQVRGILWREIGRAHRKGHLVGRVNQTEWLIGQELVGMGRKPQDYDQDAFQGIHARYVLVILDEACGIPKALWDAVDTLVTNEDSRVMAIGNPDDPTSHFAEVCKPGSGWKRFKISAFDTPNFTGEDVPEELRRLLVSKIWVEERKKRWGEDSPLYVAKVLGEFPEAGSDALIPLAWIERARERELKMTDPVELGVDIARFGDDETALAVRYGPVVRVIEVAHKQDTMTTAGHVVRARKTHRASVAKVDVVGIGGGVVDRLAELREPVMGLNTGADAVDREQFANARTEWYWGLRERLEQDDVDLDPDDEDLAGQLAGLKYKITSRGQIQVETKKEARARGLPSPDRADAVMLSFASPPPEGLIVELEEDERISPV
jgi:hypothetical protein